MSSASAEPVPAPRRSGAVIGCGPNGWGDPIARLTARERQVLGLLSEGLSNSSIAQQLCTTQRTVETHTSRIFTKLDLEATPSTHRRVLAALMHLEAVGRLRVPASAPLVGADARIPTPIRSVRPAPGRRCR